MTLSPCQHCFGLQMLRAHYVLLLHLPALVSLPPSYRLKK